MVTFCRNDAIDLLVGLQYVNAPNWKPLKPKLTKKLEEFRRMAREEDSEFWLSEEDIEDEDERNRLNNLLVSLVESKTPVELVKELPMGDENEEEPSPEEIVGDTTEDKEELQEYEETKEAEPEPDPEPVEEKPKKEKTLADEAADIIKKGARDRKKSKEPVKPKPKPKKKTKKEPKKRKSRATVRPHADAGPKFRKRIVGVRSLKNRFFLAGVLLKEKGLKSGVTEELIAELDSRCVKSNMVASKTQLSFAWHALNGYLNG